MPGRDRDRSGDDAVDQPSGQPARDRSPSARDPSDAQSPGPGRGRGDRRTPRRSGAAPRDHRCNHRTHGRRSAVCRGADQGDPGNGRGNHPGIAARLADGPPRPDSGGQGGGADRRLHRPGVRLRYSRPDRRPAGAGAPFGSRAADGGRTNLPARDASSPAVSFQACAGPRRGL